MTTEQETRISQQLRRASEYSDWTFWLYCATSRRLASVADGGGADGTERGYMVFHDLIQVRAPWYLKAARFTFDIEGRGKSIPKNDQSSSAMVVRIHAEGGVYSITCRDMAFYTNRAAACAPPREFCDWAMLAHP